MMHKNGLQTRFHILRKVHQEARFSYILMELDLAHTFFNISQTTRDAQRAARNLAYAKRAYGSATQFLQKAQLSSAEAIIVFERIERLEPLPGIYLTDSNRPPALFAPKSKN